MKCKFLCTLVMMAWSMHSFAQYQMEVKAMGQRQAFATAKVDSMEFRLGNDAIAADFTYVTTLANAIKFQLIFTEDVVKYHYHRTTLANYKKHDDEYWTKYLKEKTPLTSVETNIRSKSGVDENTQFICLVLPVDKNGNYGRLVKRVIKTSKATEQPVADISNVKHSATLLEWKTESKDKAAAYYMMVNNGNISVYKGMSDVDIAFLINKNKDTLPVWSDFSSFRKNIDKSDTNFEIVTWAQDKNGNMSGVIKRY